MNTMRSEFPMGSLFGDALPGSPALAARGSTTAGVRTLSLVIPDRANVAAGLREGRYPLYDREIKAEVWYPACPKETDEQAVYTDHMGRADLNVFAPFSIQGRAFRDAEPDQAAGPCPVIVISHGYPGSRFLLVNLAENLASKGYVVFSIGHTDNTYEDFLPQGSLESAVIHRSLDQRFVISALKELNEEGFLKGMMQPDNVGLIGFSMGGYGALRTIGARLSREALESFSAIRDELKEKEGFHGVKTVKAAVLFAPATFWFSPLLSEDIDIPTLWFCGTSDHTVHYGAVRNFAEYARRSRRVFISYERCGHNVANNPAPAEAQCASWEIYKRWADPVWDTWKLNNLNCHFVTAFLDGILKGEKEKLKYLNVPVSHGCEAVRDEKQNTGWPGFVAGGEAGIILEHFPAE